jgi:radical SAM superfamily enzyme YgiQ (UPF0313 family)
VKVLFIYPNLDAQIGFNYGVAFLSAVLKEASHETSLINVNAELGPIPTDDELLTRVNAEKPGLIGFSVVTVQYRHAVDMAAKIKRAFPHVPIIIGGIHPTMDPEGCLEAGVFDYACVGEGEEALLELVTAIESGLDTTHIRNIWARRDGRITKNPVRPFTPLEKLPPKDYGIFDFQRMIDAKDGWVGLMTSRGCPFRCSYCFNHRLVEIYQRETGLSGKDLNYIRHHSVADVIDEIKYLLAHYQGIKWFIFDDDLFTFDNAYLREFVAEYRKATGLPFVCNAHVKFFGAETARLLAEGGCRIVKFGVESGSDRVRREVMHRHMTNDEIEKAFAAGNAAGLHTSAFVMIGLPTETHVELDETVKLLARIKPGRFRWAVFFPFINTDAYDISVERGYIDFAKMKEMSNFTDDSCLDFGARQNLKIQKLRAAYPWYANAHVDDPVVKRLYSRLIRVVDGLDEETFSGFKGEVPRLDELLHQVLAKAGRVHYSLRYNNFTGVTSAWND